MSRPESTQAIPCSDSPVRLTGAIAIASAVLKHRQGIAVTLHSDVLPDISAYQFGVAPVRIFRSVLAFPLATLITQVLLAWLTDALIVR